MVSVTLCHFFFLGITIIQYVIFFLVRTVAVLQFTVSAAILFFIQYLFNSYYLIA